MIVPVILSGGSGTRLWPLSTPEKPKQFLSLVSERSLFQEALLRLEGLPDLADPIVVCNADHRELVAEQLAEIASDALAIVLEPAGRNTAPAIAVAALMASNSGRTGIQGEAVSNDPVLLVLPADHVISNRQAFLAAVTSAVEAARAGHLVTFGIVPTHPETGYGYIEQGKVAGAWSAVARFVEKPDVDTARRYVESGRFLWNSGMFVFRASDYLEELQRYEPRIAEACQQACAASHVTDGCTYLGDAFLGSPSDSIDYAVMEKTDHAAVIPLDAGWNDVGSWSALYDVLSKDGDGNAFRGDALAVDSGNSLVMASGERKIALLGVQDLVVIDAGESVLVMSRERSQEVKTLQAEIASDSD